MPIKLSNQFDKKAAFLCDEVKKLAKQLDLKVFIVCYNPDTDDGASFTSDMKNYGLENPIVHARKQHTIWEINNGINPDHKRKQNKKMNKQQFIQKYQEFLKKEKLTPNDAWVGAGGTLLLLGLRQETNDIDMGVSSELFNKFKKRNFKTHIFNGDTLVIEYDNYIDIHEENNNNLIMIDGVNSWTIQEVLKLKQKLNRPKDQEDIKNILEYIKRNNLSLENLSILNKW